MFGTEDAKEKFIDLCRRYYAYLVKAKAMAGMNERTVEVSESSRAGIHNQIMTTIYSLMTQSKLSQEKKEKLNLLANRHRVAEMIDDVFGPQSPAEKEKTSKMTEAGRFRKGEFD
ncbi:hypothetical protein L6259_03005 [Candidatus Parcubacteria bacterium]|nr:hypothetical protein [Candidatus Parcubacteria bacterium]